MSQNLDALFEAIVSANTPSMATALVLHSLELLASDIHIEPSEKNVRIRCRVDWTLHSVVEYPLNIHDSFVARIKIMSWLKTDETRMPQDGVISTTLENWWSVDLRVSTLPTVTWEKIVMRIQDKTKEIPTFKEMWIRWSWLERFEEWISKPNWIILVTGPTWSWKTTTLYSCLKLLNQPWVNIVTIEDPVEYKLHALNQCQVKHEIWFNFASWLRSILRQDPDIIMVWEIRDLETIEISLRAAMTWHLVLSTIHTNSAIATINRVIDMWVKPFLIAASVNTIQAQRLVRKVCQKCAKKYTADEATAKEIIKELKDLPAIEWIDVSKLSNSIELVKWEWCEACNNTWYKWRMGIFEVLTVDRDIEEMIIAWESQQKMLEKARSKWFITIMQDGLIKALAWLTTINEVFETANIE